MTESRAALIARDQVGKLFGESNKARQQNIGVSGTFGARRMTTGSRGTRALDGDRFGGTALHRKGIPEARQLPLLRRPGLLGTARLTKCPKHD